MKLSSLKKLHKFWRTYRKSPARDTPEALLILAIVNQALIESYMKNETEPFLNSNQLKFYTLALKGKKYIDIEHLLD